MLAHPALVAIALCPLVFAREAGAQELPSGSSAAFRQNMVDRTGPAASPPPSMVSPAASAYPLPGDSMVPLPRLSSGFGYRDHPVLGRRMMHAGIDIPGRLGTPIHASAGGVVRFSGRAGGYGAMIEIDHGDGMSTRYAHLSRLLVAPGTPVARGDVIALMGSTGRSTGSHLHFEVRMNGRAMNPLGYLRTPSASSRAGSLWSGPNWNADAKPYLSRYAMARQPRMQEQ